MDFLMFLLLAIPMLWQLVIPFFKNQQRLYSPIFFLTLFLAYYTLIPYIKGVHIVSGRHIDAGVPLYLFANFLSYSATLIGFNLKQRKVFFNKYNHYITESNAKKLGIILMVIAISVYGIFRDWNFNLFFSTLEANDFEKIDHDNHTEYYFTQLSMLFIAASCCIYVASRQKKKYLLWICLFFEVIVALMEGFRATLAIFIISYAIFYQNYPSRKKLNLKWWLPIGLVFILSLGAMERSRSYGRGYNIDVIMDMMSDNSYTESAKESSSIYGDGALTIAKFSETGDRYYFEPLLCAILQPIPRQLFPWKPNADYLKDASVKVLNNNVEGVVFSSPIEAFVSFGWIGVVVYGLFIGWLCRVFWNNFITNKDKISAIILLASFDAFLYVYVSRGYMAQVLVTYMYCVIIPFWVIKGLLKLFPSLKSNNN